jgi:hypothetical protein
MANAPIGGMTAGPPSVGNLVLFVKNDQQHFTYRSDFGNLQDTWYGTDGWHLPLALSGYLLRGPCAAALHCLVLALSRYLPRFARAVQRGFRGLAQ